MRTLALAILLVAQLCLARQENGAWNDFRRKISELEGKSGGRQVRWRITSILGTTTISRKDGEKTVSWMQRHNLTAGTMEVEQLTAQESPQMERLSRYRRSDPDDGEQQGEESTGQKIGKFFKRLFRKFGNWLMKTLGLDSSSSGDGGVRGGGARGGGSPPNSRGEEAEEMEPDSKSSADWEK
ncbi:uncharacterized protein [Anabrus simplex]|uniref:uncharacterized protein n=1 Tax=Anabrus simplex TaxID=316456 RepID=UPI0035A2A350